MAFSLGMLGIMLMLNVFFIVNYFVIRSLRRWTDHQLSIKQEQKLSKKQKKELQNQAATTALANEYAFAWLMGAIRLEALSVKKFPNWKPIPYNIGIVTTSSLVILSCILLSPELIAQQLGISTLTLDADLCVTEAFDEGINFLKDRLLNMTNLDKAKQQHQMMQDLHQALTNDTALYGVPPFQCPARGEVSGLKSDWDRKHLAQKTTFFPGYCEEALEAALEVADKRICTHEICDCPTLPDSAMFQMVGLANKKFCGEVCIEVPYPCPRHTSQEDSNDIEAMLDDYRLRQFQAAEKRQQEFADSYSYPTTVSEEFKSMASETAQKILYQVDVASYIYIGYSCIALFFPSPLVLFRMPYWIYIKRFLFGVQKPYFICFVLAAWWGYEYLRSVWYSPDLQILLTNLRLRDPCFVDLSYLVERQETVNNLCQELMPLERQFNASVITVTDVLKEVSFFSDSCSCPFPNQHLSNVTSSWNAIYNYTTEEMGLTVAMNICGNAGDNNIIEEEHCIIRVPNETEISFLGNNSICTNRTAARKLIWEARYDEEGDSTSSFETDWYNLWITSGFLATLFVKVAVANFGLSLMALADPFIVCAGEFLWIPNVNQIESQEWFRTKQRALFHVGLSRTLFWGTVVCLCMINLFCSVYQEAYKDVDLAEEDLPQLYQMLEQRDIVVLGGCLGTAFAVIALGSYFVSRLNQDMGMTNNHNEDLPDTDSSSFEGDDGPKSEKNLLEGVVIQLDVEDRCASPVFAE